MIAQQRAASLRGAFNSRPLRAELREPLLRLLTVGTDPSAVRAFYDALTTVVQKAEDLLELVAHSPSSDGSTVNGRQLSIQRDSVRATSTYAYLTGLRLLIGLGVTDESSVKAQLARLQQLEPNYVPKATDLEQLMDHAVQQMAYAVHAKAAVFEEMQPLPDQRLKQLCEFADDALRIKPDDPWNVVVGKARSLRGFGRAEEAVKAYAEYAEMFAATDPTAERYSRTAQSFTRALGHLQTEGGLFIYEVRNGGGRGAGLLDGDIIITYDGRKVVDGVDFQRAVDARPPAPGVVLTFLRLLEDGTFVRGTATLNEASLNFSTKPI